METSYNYKGYIISYGDFTGTTIVSDSIRTIAIFYGLGELRGKIKAENYINNKCYVN